MRTILIGVVLLFLVVTLVSRSWFSVGEEEQAVVTMFGQVQDVKSAGLYFKIPFLQNAQLVDTTTKGMPIGYMSGNAGERDGAGATGTHEALMITSDFNFVDIDFYIEYRVSDPVAYLYNSDEPEEILRNIAQATIRSTVVNYSVDDVITTAKSQIQSEVMEKIIQELEEMNIGLQVANVSIQDAEPPTDAVIEAFKAVETAKQGADTAVNNAKRYQSERVPAAEAEADRIIQAAEAEKAARIAEAEGQVERFNRMYAEYAKYPLITRQRLFYEAIEEVLPGAKVIITDGGTQTMLPLESFTEAGTAEEETQDAAKEKEQNAEEDGE
ncbi:MAG: FtsH protease activity modulator HflK [Lachnospiraceae bacterium]|nr:FtsH protease activity modulator HflK [Lachnospiraceae bacterium]